MLRKRLILTTIISMLTIPLLVNNVSAQTASEIIKKSEDALRGRSQIAIYSITIKTKRWTRVMTLKSWENRLKKKSFSEITAPAKDAGNRFLLINKNMMQYTPKLAKVIKISPSMMLQSWMGSDFTNDDIVKESSILKDYYHKIIGKETVDGNECYKIEMLPKPDSAVVWGKIIYFARVKDALPVKQEFYNEHNVLKKVMNFSNFKKMHDRVIPTVYKMQTVSKKDKFTLMEIKRIKFNVNINPNIFTLQNLKRR